MLLKMKEWIMVSCCHHVFIFIFFFFQAEDGIRDIGVTGVQTCALPIIRTEMEKEIGPQF